MKWGQYIINDIEKIPDNIYDYTRIVLSNSNLMNNYKMSAAGYIMIDRMLTVSISLQKLQNINRMIRLPVIKTDVFNNEEISSIAYSNFKNDSRFIITLDAFKEDVYKQILDDYLNTASDTFICEYKDKIIGFAKVTFPNEYGNSPFFHLVAVNEEYRLTGAAVSLYSQICKYYCEHGFSKIYGCISTKNINVINLYAKLGGVFTEPQDIYVKMENNNEYKNTL